jgi:hypothetical protein
MINRIRVARVLPDLTTEQVFAFRMAGTQDDAEAFGHRLQTRWMELNPGHATVMSTDWPTSEELGGNHVQPARPDMVVLSQR